MTYEPRCWICLRPLALPQPCPEPPPFYFHVCNGCWNALPAEKRLEFSARFTPSAEGGFGELELRNQLAGDLAELVQELRRAIRAFGRAAERSSEEDDEWWRKGESQ